MINEKIENILDEVVRPRLLLHGGGIQSIDFEQGIYRFLLIGQCANCPSAYLETEEFVRNTLLQMVPEVQQVVLEHSVNEELLMQARAILNRQIREL